MEIINHLIQTHSREGETEDWQEELTYQLAPSHFLPSLLSAVKRIHCQESIFQIQIMSSPLVKLFHWPPVLQLQDTTQIFYSFCCNGK